MSETAAKHKAEAPKRLNFAIVICSTSRYKKFKSTGEVDDPSGDLIAEILRRHGHVVVSRTMIPDEKLLIERSVEEALESRNTDVIISCGGTGISPTDVTIETVQPLLEKELNGFGEILRKISYEQIGSAAVLTRAIAGVSKGKAVFCLPGSPQAVSLALERLILPEAGHIVKHARES
jgi:molybdenum cofactor biosynthesis protein B